MREVGNILSLIWFRFKQQRKGANSTRKHVIARNNA